jgi:hypothetical protein
MKSKSKRKIEMPITAESLGLDMAQYQAALKYLFDRPLPSEHGNEWYWNNEEPDFPATSIAWVKIQTLLFANSGLDLLPYDNERVGMGLHYLMSNAISNVPFCVVDPNIDIQDAMQLMKAFKVLWRDCIGPRLRDIDAPVGSVSEGSLSFVCYMWFDVSPVFFTVKDIPEWRDAQWSVLEDMLNNPCREVQISALHGIGHEKRYLQRDAEINARMERFIRQINPTDTELRAYAQAAQYGMVQ